MQFTEKMVELQSKLRELGHDAYLTELHSPFIGKSDVEKEKIKIHHKMHKDAIRVFWRAMQGGDAVLVANYDKHGITGYIGGNTFMEMGFAHVLDQAIYLLNPIPDIPYYKIEIEAMRPIILNGDLGKISS